MCKRSIACASTATYTILVLVEQIGGAACHEGYKSCFFTEITNDGERTCSPKVFDPKEVYK